MVARLLLQNHPIQCERSRRMGHLKPSIGCTFIKTRPFPNLIHPLGEGDTHQVGDTFAQYLVYDQLMTRVYIADSIPIERSALRTLILDLKMDVVGEAADWLTTLSNAPKTR